MFTTRQRARRALVPLGGGDDDDDDDAGLFELLSHLSALWGREGDFPDNVRTLFDREWVELHPVAGARVPANLPTVAPEAAAAATAAAATAGGVDRGLKPDDANAAGPGVPKQAAAEQATSGAADPPGAGGDPSPPPLPYAPSTLLGSYDDRRCAPAALWLLTRSLSHAMPRGGLLRGVQPEVRCPLP
jgi:hypothetical protein